ncbi:uncharacterized protein K02A2.6 [Trichonephila clavipes]|uniref:Uncharacterized protein K02A2.6 n=1 Tax=Trichonephila clavipes TaxID=2585209 RepID=A0A8X6VLY5_TRICX|nr:uncharacterized protein K02A2.6 [Trichonephila clavipes]
MNVIPKSELLKWDEKPVLRTCKIAVLDYSDNGDPILGLEACRELKLIQRLNMIYKSPIETLELILKEFADVLLPKKLRICLDPRPLNEVIQKPYYPIPTTDALITKLQVDKEFNILDAKNGLGQLPLDEESSYLTTSCTPWGRYRFLVLPFGLNFAPEEFQKAMEEIYEEDENIIPYFVDIALGSSTVVEEHCRLLRRTLLKATKANLKFNVLKAQLSQT